MRRRTSDVRPPGRRHRPRGTAPGGRTPGHCVAGPVYRARRRQGPRRMATQREGGHRAGSSGTVTDATSRKSSLCPGRWCGGSTRPPTGCSESSRIQTAPVRWRRYGLVVGQVQSGKTGNYIGLACKAADAGYKLIVILAGIDNSLRSQTQLRVDEGLPRVRHPVPAALRPRSTFKIGVGALRGRTSAQGRLPDHQR